MPVTDASLHLAQIWNLTVFVAVVPLDPKTPLAPRSGGAFFAPTAERRERRHPVARDRTSTRRSNTTGAGDGALLRPVAQDLGQERVDHGGEQPSSPVAMRQMMSWFTAGYSCRRMLPMAAMSHQGPAGRLRGP